MRLTYFFSIEHAKTNSVSSEVVHNSFKSFASIFGGENNLESSGLLDNKVLAAILFRALSP